MASVSRTQVVFEAKRTKSARFFAELQALKALQLQYPASTRSAPRVHLSHLSASLRKNLARRRRCRGAENIRISSEEFYPAGKQARAHSKIFSPLHPRYAHLQFSTCQMPDLLPFADWDAPFQLEQHSTQRRHPEAAQSARSCTKEGQTIPLEDVNRLSTTPATPLLPEAWKRGCPSHRRTAAVRHSIIEDQRPPEG